MRGNKSSLIQKENQMKFKESKSIIDLRLDQEGDLLLSMNGEIFKSLLKKGDKKVDGKVMDFISSSFTPFFSESVFDDKGECGDDFILISKESWNHYLNLI